MSGAPLSYLHGAVGSGGFCPQTSMLRLSLSLSPAFHLLRHHTKFPFSADIPPQQLSFPLFCSSPSRPPQASDISDSCKCSDNNEGSKINIGSKVKKAFTSTEMMDNLRRNGVSGVLSYGILNTVYYITAFLVVWLYVAPAPGRMGYAAAVERFLKVMAMVWAGSQVTKVIRAAGALALAPFVDRGLSLFTEKFRFRSRGKGL